MKRFYIKHYLAWLLLWWWFLYHRIRPSKRYKHSCECGELVECSTDNWYGWHKWKGWLVTMTDLYSPAHYEYGGYGWQTHTTCWACGRQHHFWDSSV